MNLDKCPNCGKSLKGFLSAELLSESRIEFINKYSNETKTAYCTSCSTAPIEIIEAKLKKQKEEIESRIKKIIQAIPILTSPAPSNWEYEVIGMVSAQTTSGTGFITELSRSFNDLLGSGSNSTNQKIEKATNLCKADLRVQCVSKGGNVIISADIDFNEIGAGSTNMLMVCMAGTAIKVKELLNISDERKNTINEVIELTKKLNSLNKETV